MRTFEMVTRILLFLISLGLLSGCAQTANRYNSSAVDYLYPDRNPVVETAEISHLQLPIKVGVAFAPSNQGMADRRSGGWITGYISGETDRQEVLTESDKIKLLEKVSRRFEALEFVHAIEIIPSAYLVPRGSFPNLDQIRTMFGIDVIALVSYDQAQFTDEGFASITYWTLVRAYVIPGEKNATHTMVDAAVYDIKSRVRLFRAPGVSYVKSTATPVNLYTRDALWVDWNGQGFVVMPLSHVAGCLSAPLCLLVQSIAASDLKKAFWPILCVGSPLTVKPRYNFKTAGRSDSIKRATKASVSWMTLSGHRPMNGPIQRSRSVN
ncbi:MAG: rhombotarget lipoprotein [Deltaproteobacteria bacterium]|nr:rhombotarget lipoprotein [Deltaproteobacteria bacterium]